MKSRKGEDVTKRKMVVKGRSVNDISVLTAIELGIQLLRRTWEEEEEMSEL